MNNLNPSRKLAIPPRAGSLFILFLLAALLATSVTQAAGLVATNTPAAIPWSEIGAKAGANYQGDGLVVTPTESGARLHCVFQRLDGEATPEGLWLTSTVTNMVSDRFRVTAMAVGRTAANATSNPQYPESSIPLADAGQVSVCGQTARLSRPGLTEEYSVSMDGVRQDFIVEQSPAGPPRGELVVKLAVSGAQVEAAADGPRLVLDHSGRKIAYSRLRVTDAMGRQLPARIEVCPVGCDATSLNFSDLFGSNIEEKSLLTSVPTSGTLAVVVNDAEAVYPVRIDPTFSDANWVSMGGFPGVNSSVYAAVIDGSGNLYIGGYFTTVGNIFATNIAEWNGSSWSALGSGVGGEAGTTVDALAVSGSTLYVGGGFTTAGGISASNIAQWNGNSWSALGSGVNSGVDALAVSGGTLFAGGYFTTAGGSAANYIAQWNGGSWSPLGSGMSGGLYGTYVTALAVSGSTLFAGGVFTTAGSDTNANYIAQWNGSSWSALGSGMNNPVSSLVVSGSTLFAGGDFTTAGDDTNANCIAQWNGSSWSSLGSGISGAGSDGNLYVNALAVSGSTLFVGGDFTTAGDDTNANYIAQWNGSSWSSLGSGMNNPVIALAVSGSTLFAGGSFTTAGSDTNANYIAQWNGSSWSSLGSGISGAGSYGLLYVDALAVSGGTLFAGGFFTTAGGTPANYIAQWNGSSWSALGSGMSGGQYGTYVTALAVSGSTLYAGGGFTTAGGSAANNIAQWNGSSWSALGSGMNNPVIALAVSGSTLFAGGTFTTAGDDTNANYIAQWNGSSWSSLGSGISGAAGSAGNLYVTALAVSGSTLYVGGIFTTAGTNVSAYAAMANLPVPPTLSIIADSANMVLTWPATATGYTTGYTLESATNLLPPVVWQTNSTAPIVIGGQNVITNPIPITGSQQFFRLFNP